MFARSKEGTKRAETKIPRFARDDKRAFDWNDKRTFSQEICFRG